MLTGIAIFIGSAIVSGAGLITQPEENLTTQDNNEAQYSYAATPAKHLSDDEAG